MSLWADIGAIFSAFLSQDSFEIQSALESDAAWVLGAIVSAIGGIVIPHRLAHSEGAVS